MWPKFLRRKPKPEPEERQIADREVAALLTELKSHFVSLYTQEALSGLDEHSTNVMKQFKATVARRCWKLSQKWCQWGENKPILQPNQSRLFYRKGATDIMVVELEPTVRTLRFSVNFEEGGSFNLALPYTVFIFRFINGLFCDVYCMFNDKPLGDLSERPMKPYLTNINTDLRCCLGSSFALPSGLNYNQTVQFIINYFWTAAHSNEWADHWAANKDYFCETDARLATLSAWQAATQDNPLFVIDDVTWSQHNRTIGDIIVGLTNTDTTAREFEETIFADLVNEFVGQVSAAMRASLEQGGQKVNSLAPELTERKLIKAMRKFNILEK